MQANHEQGSIRIGLQRNVDGGFIVAVASTKFTIDPNQIRWLWNVETHILPILQVLILVLIAERYRC